MARRVRGLRSASIANDRPSAQRALAARRAAGEVDPLAGKVELLKVNPLAANGCRQRAGDSNAVRDAISQAEHLAVEVPDSAGRAELRRAAAGARLNVAAAGAVIDAQLARRALTPDSPTDSDWGLAPAAEVGPPQALGDRQIPLIDNSDKRRYGPKRAKLSAVGTLPVLRRNRWRRAAIGRRPCQGPENWNA